MKKIFAMLIFSFLVGVSYAADLSKISPLAGHNKMKRSHGSVVHTTYFHVNSRDSVYATLVISGAPLSYWGTCDFSHAISVSDSGWIEEGRVDISSDDANDLAATGYVCLRISYIPLFGRSDSEQYQLLWNGSTVTGSTPATTYINIG